MSPEGRQVVRELFGEFFPGQRCPEGNYEAVSLILRARHHFFPRAMPAGLWDRFLHVVEEELDSSNDYPDQEAMEWVLGNVREELHFDYRQFSFAPELM